jgi:ribokinase
MGRVIVVGSANSDMVIQAGRIPRPGETVLGGEFLLALGGKGANQAVAAARLEAEVALVACLGTDVFAAAALDAYRAEGIDCRAVFQVDAAPSGVALIMVDAAGENSIAVAPGANAHLTPARVAEAEAVLAPGLASGGVLLVQLEIPLATVQAALELGRRHGLTTILNPAPMQPLSRGLLALVDWLTPNRGEAAELAGVAPETDFATLAAGLHAAGVRQAVVTLGAAGVLLVPEGGPPVHLTGFSVTPRDTTAAGDAFNGGLAAGLSAGLELRAAVRQGQAAGALATLTRGAQPSLPRAAAVAALLRM